MLQTPFPPPALDDLIDQLWSRFHANRPTDITDEQSMCVQAGFRSGVMGVSLHLMVLSQSDRQLFAQAMSALLGPDGAAVFADPDSGNMPLN